MTNIIVVAIFAFTWIAKRIITKHGQFYLELKNNVRISDIAWIVLQFKEETSQFKGLPTLQPRAVRLAINRGTQNICLLHPSQFYIMETLFQTRHVSWVLRKIHLDVVLLTFFSPFCKLNLHGLYSYRRGVYFIARRGVFNIPLLIEV